MSTFTAIALDGLLERGPSQSIDKSLPKLLPPNPNPGSLLERRNGNSVAEMNFSRPQIRPELYATPESIQLPLSPSFFSPSPYVINHKRRGPRLIHSFSEDNVSFDLTRKEEERLGKIAEDLESRVVIMNEDFSFAVAGSGLVGEDLNEDCSDKEEPESSRMSKNLVRENDLLDIVASNLDSDEESEDFFDPRESMSIASNTDDENAMEAESSQKPTTPTKDFLNSWPKESSEHGSQEVDSELRKMRLNVLMEIEKRKQVEESLNKMKSHWLKIKQQLHFEGIAVPEDPTAAMDGEEMDSYQSEGLCQQIYVARLASEAIGRGISRAVMEMEMEAQVELKNYEINQLSCRIRRYETVNHEMSQRNQEAVEMSRRERLIRRKRKQKWIWGSIAAAITFGTATLAWSYIPSARGSSSSYHLYDNEQGEPAK